MAELKLDVVAACPMSWDDLDGDDRVRHCAQCNLQVYNVAELSAAETLALIESTEGRVCGRLLKRPDGTVMTRDCHLVLRTARRGWKRLVGTLSAGLAVLAAAAGALGLSRWMPPMPTPTTCPPPSTTVEPPIMGEIMIPTPTVTQPQVDPLHSERLGRIALPSPRQEADHDESE